ncbi:aminoacyl-tRNA hydrolase [Candidatus Parcubacteria bacterium A4]|nr:MAG: aminoacyl-tRNA hydrolase [Candidatus Parcubacteria bacterium A4]
MILIVGLGNPGEKFKNTRHNIGFRAIDGIAVNFQFPIFNAQAIFNAQVSKGKINEQDIILAKPQTFMNLSGKTIKKIIENYKLEIKNLVVIHDDIDLPLGKMKIVKNRGTGGHKGVESITMELKTKDFIRIRLGVISEKGKPENIEKFVLQNFPKKEEKIIEEMIKKTISVVEMILNQGIEKTMSAFNQ